MRTTNTTNNSTVVAACAALAVTAATAALQQRRMVARVEEDQEISYDKKNIQTIWRENQINKDDMVIEKKESIDSTESMDSPKSAEPVPFEQEDVPLNKPSSETSVSMFHVKDICMIAAWVVCVAMAKWNGTPSMAVPSNEMTARHVSDDLVHRCIGEPQGTFTATPSPLTKLDQEESNDVMVDTPIFISAEPPTCWIVETRVEPSNGMYGLSIGADSLTDLERLHHTDISELSGVYGSLVVDAPYEIQFKSVVLEDFIKKHASEIESKVELPRHGVYGAFLAPNEAELKTVGAAFQAWLDHTVTIDEAVYGGYVNWRGLDIPPGILETFAEFQTEWSLHQQVMIRL